MDVDFLRYQFEDGYDGVISKTKFKIGVRHIQILYMFVCSIVVGSLRGTVGIGLLAMTDSSRENDGYIQIHDWNRRTQGTILSSFFFGHAMSLIPAELYLKKVGGKIVITAVLAVNGALCVAMPTIANEGGWIAVCNAHFLMGMTQACICPINQALLEKWLPPSEKTIFGSIIYFVTLLTTWLQATLLKCLGIHLGVILALPITALISEARLGWELIYYSQAMLTISMAVIWVLLTANSPAQHQAVGDKEKEFVAEALSSYKKKDQQIPWRSLLNSKQFWSIIFAHAASNAVFVFYLTEVSAYLKLLGGTLRKIGVTAMIPFIGIWFINRVSAPMVDYLSKVGFVSYLVNLTQFRRLINGIGGFGTVIGLTVLPHLMPNGGFFSMAVFVTTFSVIGFQYCGFIENLKDISDSYRGTLVTVSCVVSGSVGALVPLFTGLFISDNDMTNVRRWRTVFITLSSFYVLCNIIYTGFSSSERQNWDTGKRHEKFGYHNSLIDATNLLELEDLKQTKPEQRIYEDSAL